MKLLVYADLQATDGSDLCFTQPNTTLQHYRVSRFFDDIVKIYDKHRCTGIVDLGDTTDDRSSIPINTLDVLGAGLDKLPNASNWKLTGNHEQFFRDTSINNRYLFSQKFKVIDNRSVHTVGNTSGFFASYPADHADLAEWISKEARRVRGPKILFGHFQVEGAYYQGGQALTGIPKSVLADFDLVMLGHIHLPQSVTPKIHYVGSPFQQDWGETGQSKRVGIVNTETLSVEWVPLTGYPEYRSVSLDVFEKYATDTEEHRYSVTLNSHEEAERYFSNPKFSRAVAKYNYTETAATETSVAADDWSFDGICRRYMKMVPPDRAGISLDNTEMLEIAEQVLKG